MLLWHFQRVFFGGGGGAEGILMQKALLVYVTVLY